MPIMKYLKNLDKTRKYSKDILLFLKTFFTYLDETNNAYKYIKLEDLVEFMGWLRSPYGSLKFASLQQVKDKRIEKN
ncbi:hypothetical protein JNUCC6_16660 [Viridibacillus arvi]|nr:hypothetical protein [Viridibacillus sp. JNUCC-6]QOV10205.1 hypothetical protein JNUCC6_16660 [Viridibacillus sp. JNUCC-6]